MQSQSISPRVPVPPPGGPARAGLTVLPFVLAAASLGALYAAVRDRLPDRMATHFEMSGTADDFVSTSGFVGVAVGMIMIFGVVFGGLTVAGARAGRPRTVVTFGYGLAGLLGYLMGAVLLSNADVADPATVHMPVWQIGPGLGAGLIAAAAGWALAGRDPSAPPAPDSGTAPRLPLGPGEAAGWSRTMTSRALVVVAALEAAGALALGLAGLWTGAACLLTGTALIGAFTSVRVTVDRHGLTVSSSLVPRPRRRIPLARVAEAGSRPVSARADFGGWGYRVREGKSGVILRSGESLALRLTDGREFVVTVDDAAIAAALLNTLADRARTAPEQGPGA
ncbi:DUF1648 domain-containing protein [Streptomyces sp. NPDC003077]|uniref:DUF1648 domain-containing protein n=1 Tax=Streptomyces sp. NPDC003077 TaxID=3154443 RepID=UPI00339F7C82